MLGSLRRLMIGLPARFIAILVGFPGRNQTGLDDVGSTDRIFCGRTSTATEPRTRSNANNVYFILYPAKNHPPDVATNGTSDRTNETNRLFPYNIVRNDMQMRQLQTI